MSMISSNGLQWESLSIIYRGITAMHHINVESSKRRHKKTQESIRLLDSYLVHFIAKMCEYVSKDMAISQQEVAREDIKAASIANVDNLRQAYRALIIQWVDGMGKLPVRTRQKFKSALDNGIPINERSFLINLTALEQFKLRFPYCIVDGDHHHLDYVRAWGSSLEHPPHDINDVRVNAPVVLNPIAQLSLNSNAPVVTEDNTDVVINASNTEVDMRVNTEVDMNVRIHPKVDVPWYSHGFDWDIDVASDSD